MLAIGLPRTAVPGDDGTFQDEGLGGRNEEVVGTCRQAVIVEDDGRVLLAQDVGKLDRLLCITADASHDEKAILLQPMKRRGIAIQRDSAVETENGSIFVERNRVRVAF